MTDLYIPKRGDILYMDFSPNVGHEQGGWRPAVVISPDDYNASSNTALLCPITNNIQPWPWKILIPKNQAIQGAVLVDQLVSRDYRKRGAKYHARFSQEFMQEVLHTVSTLTS